MFRICSFTDCHARLALSSGLSGVTRGESGSAEGRTASGDYRRLGRRLGRAHRRDGGLAGGGRRGDWADRKSVTKIGLTPILAPLTKIPPFVTTGAG